MNHQFKLLQCLVSITVLFSLPMKASAQITPPGKLTLEPVKGIFVTEQGYANNLQELLKQPDIVQNVTRRATWEKRVQLDKMQSPPEITYILKDDYSRRNSFSNVNNPNSRVDVIVKHVGITNISSNTVENYAILQGIVEFEFDPKQSPIAGEHRGSLTICVKSIGSDECL